MKISTRGRYAVRMLLDIARHQGKSCVTLKDISAREGISRKYLEQIALQLVQSGILTGSRGHNGGYTITGSPAKIDIYRVLRVTEGPMVPVACLEHTPIQCERCGDCLTLPLWAELDRHIRGYLEHVSIQDVLDGHIRLDSISPENHTTEE